MDNKKVCRAQIEPIAEPFGVIHFCSVFLPNKKGLGVTSRLQFLLICRFGESDEIYAAQVTIIAGQTASYLKIHPNVHNMYEV